jgi:tRNA threonylcarbamoyladenosine biosynthesis protein TsaE
MGGRGRRQRRLGRGVGRGAGVAWLAVLFARTAAVAETRALGAALAELARRGDLVLLSGDLGAGKTAFAQGFGQGLGVTEAITSPTFTLAREYQGDRLRFHHLDVYRMEAMAELFDVDLPELLDDDGVVLIEWGDAIIPAVPGDYLEVAIRLGDGDDDRELELRVVGPSWTARSRAVATAVEPWAKVEA